MEKNVNSGVLKHEIATAYSNVCSYSSEKQFMETEPQILMKIITKGVSYMIVKPSDFP